MDKIDIDSEHFAYLFKTLFYLNEHEETISVSEDAYNIMIAEITMQSPILHVNTTNTLLKRMFSKYTIDTYNTLPFILKNNIGQLIYDAINNTNEMDSYYYWDNNQTFTTVRIEPLINIVLASRAQNNALYNANKESQSIPVSMKTLINCLTYIQKNKNTCTFIQETLPNIKNGDPFKTLPHTFLSLCCIELEDVFPDIEIDTTIPINYTNVLFPLIDSKISSSKRDK